MKTTRFLVAAALLTAAGGALAHGGYYGPVVRGEPSVMISFGTPGYYGFSMAYGPGAYGYWGPPPYPPPPVVVAPPPYRGKYGYPYRYYGPGYRGPGRPVPYGPPRHWHD
jgi:hypothetical protein